jgi:hypothetical protein
MTSVEPFKTVPAHQQRQHGLTLSSQGIIQIKCKKKKPWLTTKTPVSITGTSRCLLSESCDIQTPCEPAVKTSQTTGRRVD